MLAAAGGYMKAVISQTYRSRLGLRDQVLSQHGGLAGSLLDSGRLFKTIRVDTPKQFIWEIHSVESFRGFIPVGIKIGIGEAARGLTAAISSLLRWLITV